tara:strand:- start:1149 stop:2006 length:858 start_codon:yes stop_codon:yes gene_type:complete
MKKFLTVLAGHPRGGESTWGSIYKNVLEPLESDLAICTGSKWIENQSFLEEAKYKWIIEEPSNWFDYYEDNFTGNWKSYFNLGKDTGLYNSGSIHYALKDIILKNNIQTLKEYENIIYTRFDQFFIDKQPFFKNDKILIPEGEDYFGICDRHALVPVQYIEKYLDICSYVDSSASLENIPDHLNCEVSYQNYLNFSDLDKHIYRHERTQFTAALKDDFTNWRVPKYKIYYFSGLMMKYPDEFISSIKNYKDKNGYFKIMRSLKIFFINYVYLETRRFFGKLKNLP